MKLKPAIAAILSATALLASSTVLAETFIIGALPSKPNPAYEKTLTKDPGNFLDTFNFVFTTGPNQLQTVAQFLPSSGITGLTIKLFESGNLVPLETSTTPSATQSLLSFSGLTTGIEYRLEVNGFANESNSTYQVLASAVPEPGTYALFLAGLTAVGWLSRRRRTA
jgi:hypothetical protein